MVIGADSIGVASTLFYMAMVLTYLLVGNVEKSAAGFQELLFCNLTVPGKFTSYIFEVKIQNLHCNSKYVYF